MFISDKGFAALVRDEFKNGTLIVGRESEDDYIIAGSWWIIRTNIVELPKEKKAELIKLIGDMPTEIGEAVLASKDSMQYEMIEGRYENIMDVSRWSSGPELQKTNVILESGLGRQYRVFQCQGTNKVNLLNEKLSGYLGSRSVDIQMGHTLMEGPYMDDEGRAAYFCNNIMTMMVLTALPPDRMEQIVKALEEADLNGEE